MLDLSKIEMNEMFSDVNVVQMINEMLEDNDTFEEYCCSLSKYKAVKVSWKDINIGYFIYGDTEMPGRKEVHCFFYPRQRRYTFQVLRAIQDFFKENGWGIYTTVTGPYKYIVKVLERIGFHVFDVTEDAVHKGGMSYPVFHLVNTF